MSRRNVGLSRVARVLRREVVALIVAAVAAAVVFLPAIARSRPSPSRSADVIGEPFPASDARELESRLTSSDASTFRGALDPSVAPFVRVIDAMLPSGSLLRLDPRLVRLRDVGSVDATVTGPRFGRYRLHLAEDEGHWRLFATERLDGTHAPPTRFARAATPAALAPAPATPPTASRPACDVPGHALPVLLVHGFADSPAVFMAGSPSLVGVLAAIPGVAVTTFDYSSASRDWVDAAPIGPTLAARIDCLARASASAGGRGKVVVVAHSMGGLAARWAVSQTLAGTRVANDLAAVVTLGTPESGSYLATEATRLTEPDTPDPSVLGAFVRASCPALPQEHGSNRVCDLVAQARTPAVLSMTTGSRALAALPSFPPSLPVTAVSGDVQLTVQIFDARPVVVQHAGDLVVDDASALGDATNRVTVSCDLPLYQSVGDVHVLASLAPRPQLALLSLYTAEPPCWHLSLPTNPDAQRAVVDAIHAAIGSSP